MDFTLLARSVRIYVELGSVWARHLQLATQIYRALLRVVVIIVNFVLGGEYPQLPRKAAACEMIIIRFRSIGVQL